MILSAAFVPALVLLGIVCIIARRDRDPFVYCGLLFLGGALLSAPAAAAINQVLNEWLGLAPSVMSQLGAPVIEEVSKALVVLLSLRLATPASESRIALLVVRGLCVGLGFTAMENTQYLLLASLQGGILGLWEGAFVRGLAWGMHHAVFAAAGAVAVSYALGPNRDFRRVLVWILFAIAQHVAWNSLGAPRMAEVLCAAPATQTACQWPPDPTRLFVLTPLLSVAAIFPGLVAVVAVRRGERKKG
jgi:RsiW-degrading membrane proteinase PrsW (M82 family)